EEEVAARAVALAGLCPQGFHAGDVGAGVGGEDARLGAAAQGHGEVPAEPGEAAVHLAGDRPADGAPPRTPPGSPRPGPARSRGRRAGSPAPRRGSPPSAARARGAATRTSSS